MSKPFRFKEFTVQQDKTAMKIGTDGVLLGAWTPIKQRPFSILDIGSGTGVVALMLAQRSTAEIIDAIELDDDAYEQCVDNFEASPWNDRLFCYHASLDEFVEEIDDTYDLIVSNPPFYTDDFISDDIARAKARSTESLSFESLLAGTASLLTENGYAAFIIPYKEEEKFIELAATQHLYLEEGLRIQGTPKSDIKRSLLYFSRQKKAPNFSNLIIEKERHQYTEAYIALTKAFYLKF